MWALRRAANPLRCQSNRLLVARNCWAESDNLGGNTEHGDHPEGENRIVRGRTMPHSYFYGASICLRSLSSNRNFSSQAGAKSGDSEDELAEGFSDLDTPSENHKAEYVAEKEDEDVASEAVIFEEESDEIAENTLELSDGETDVDGERKAVGLRVASALSRIILETPRQSMDSALDKWVSEGKPLGRDEIYSALLRVRRRRLYGKALQFLEWAEAKKCLDFTERDYASHLDMIAKVHGIQRAEKYIDKIPKSFVGELLYRTFLANSVATGNIKKSEEIFNKMKDLGFPATTFACNQLLLLYKRNDRKKVPDVLLMMEKDGVKPSLFTYRLLIDIKGRANDIQGMESVLELMRGEGMEADLSIQSMLAKYYIYGNVNEKAEAIAKEMEGEDVKDNRNACRELLLIYAALGKSDDVERIWKVCEPDPRLEECLTAIEAWGKLGKIENAEKVFELMMMKWKKLSARYYNALLKVYANHKLLAKGKDLAKRMLENGCRVGPLTWDALVKLYVESGEVEKADSILQKAAQQNQMRPLYTSYIAVLDKYAMKGDVHNSEKIFEKLRQAGYVGRMRQYQTLLQAYINAKTPAYGFRERLKADNMFPNRAVAAQLVVTDGFKRNEISELLD